MIPELRELDQNVIYGVLGGFRLPTDGDGVDILVAYESPKVPEQPSYRLVIGDRVMVDIASLVYVDGALRLRLNAAAAEELYQKVLRTDDADLWITLEGSSATSGCRDLMLPFKLISLNQQAEWITRMSGPMAFLCPRGTEDQPWLPLISRTEEAKSTPGTPRITAVVWDPTATYTRGQVVAHPDQNGVPRYWVAAHDNQNCVPGVPVGPSPAPDLDAAEISDIGAGDGGEGAAAPAGASA